MDFGKRYPVGDLLRNWLKIISGEGKAKGVCRNCVWWEAISSREGPCTLDIAGLGQPRPWYYRCDAWDLDNTYKDRMVKTRDNLERLRSLTCKMPER